MAVRHIEVRHGLYNVAMIPEGVPAPEPPPRRAEILTGRDAYRRHGRREPCLALPGGGLFSRTELLEILAQMDRSEGK